MWKRAITAWAVVLILASGTAAWSYLKDSASGTAMAGAAEKFLSGLSAEQKAIAQLPYDAVNRTDWHFIPKPTRKGLQIRDMKPEQRPAALALLRAALSQIGYDKTTKIMALEAMLFELEKNKKGGNIRDTERYFFTVFGSPAAKGRWGLSIEGHHMSLNFVVEDGKVISSTPLALCTNPAEVKAMVVPSIEKGLRVLAKEETLAFDLLASLTPEQRKTAIIADKAPAEVRAPGEVHPPTDAAVGIAASALTAAQQQTLRSLIGAYADNVPADVAADRWSRIEAAGWENVKFAWAGPDKAGVGHYYRIQGPSFVIELVNTQPDAAGNPANHVHCLWRDMAGDFALPIK